MSRWILLQERRLPILFATIEVVLLGKVIIELCVGVIVAVVVLSDEHVIDLLAEVLAASILLGLQIALGPRLIFVRNQLVIYAQLVAEVVLSHCLDVR